MCGLVKIKSCSDDNGTVCSFCDYVLHFKVYRSCSTDAFAESALTSLEIDTVLPVDHWFVRHSLWKQGVNGLTFALSLVEFVVYFLRTLSNTFAAPVAKLRVNAGGPLADGYIEVADVSGNSFHF